MAKNVKKINIKSVEIDEHHEKKIERMAKAREKICYSKQDREIAELGYQIAISGKPIPEEYKENGKFKTGYDRGTRVLLIQEFEKNKKIIEQMVKENIPLSEAPESIQKDENLVKYYKYCQMLKTVKDKKGKNK